MNNKILAGLVAGVPLAVVLLVYMLLRGKALVAVISSQGGSTRMSEKLMYYLFLGTFILAALGFGALSGVIYGRLGSRQMFLGLALGLATLFSILAFVSRTPLPWDKVFMNYAVGGMLGLLVPLLADLT
jgi:hypothetical protein